MAKVLLYGLSANPPTGEGGHQGIVAHFAKEFDELWVMPVYKHIYQTKRELAAFENRVRMCEIAFMENPRVNARGREKAVPKSLSFTRKTLQPMPPCECRQYKSP